MMKRTRFDAILSPLLAAGLVAVAAACQPTASSPEIGEAAAALSLRPGNGYNLHLEDTVRFDPIKPFADADRGRRRFGLAADLETSDDTEAKFEGFSVPFGGVVTGNGRTCFTCHRGLSTRLGLPFPPLSASIPLSDPLFTGIDGDAQGDPDAFVNLDELALIKYRPNRFNPILDQSSPFKQVFFWRKSIQLVNVAFAHSFLNDGRARVMRETDRGAVFSHTQSSDGRFDDLFSAADAHDLEAFQFSIVTDPTLLALRDPGHPLHETLKNDPFYTVNTQTPAEHRGKQVFAKYCMDCHNTPNIFNNLSNVEPLGNGECEDSDPCFGPSVARTFNIGVSERNRHNLRFTRDLGGGQFAPIVLPLVDKDGVVTQVEVTFDVGLAATTGRMEDLGRFKVPPLRGVKDAWPYFHDNSADTIEEVVDYFNSPAYNRSKDGKRYPIHLSPTERADLIAFLYIL